MIETLREALARRSRRALPDARPRAAVLVPIIEDGGAPRLLLTRRTTHLSSHGGQVAFPGGRVDPGDADATDAALREAFEEVALPRAFVDVLGLLDDFPTVRGEMLVTPVVAHLAEVPPLRAEPGEVARIFTIPIVELRRADRWRVQDYEESGRRWPIYLFDHDGETLWGLSAYITLQVLALTEEGAPFTLPPPWG